jgi:hypothetical protein
MTLNELKRVPGVPDRVTVLVVFAFASVRLHSSSHSHSRVGAPRHWQGRRRRPDAEPAAVRGSGPGQHRA